MIEAEKTALILLAAGQSKRFGREDKLAMEFLHKPLAYHVATAMEGVPFLTRIAVVDGCKLDFESRGYTVVHNDAHDEGMSRSVRLGIEHVRKTDAQAVLIVLADMPRVTAAHVYRLLDAAVGDDAVVASSDGEKPCPPALFGRGRFDFLATLEGDAGARDLVRAGKHVVTAPAELIDIDTPQDLERLRAIAHSPQANGAVTRPEARGQD